MRLFRRKERETPDIDERTPITDVRYVVIDTELTGLDEKSDAILSLGAVRMTGGRIEVGAPFSRLVSPERDLQAENVVVHEITPSDVAETPSIRTVLPEFLAYCGDAVLVGHFLAIDMGFIGRDALRCTGRPVTNALVDTVSLLEWLRKRRPDDDRFAGPPNQYRLYDIARSFGVTVSSAHHALMDAYITAQMFQRMIPLLRQSGARTIGDLVRIGRPFEGGDRSKATGEFCNL
jgi:DNA polymerase III subunit epsilon